MANPRPVLLRAFGWFFAALCMVALLSPPGAVHDEWYHATSIWCGQGEREPYCPEKFPQTATARTNLDAIDCKRSQETPLICPTENVGESEYISNFGLYPPMFYFTLSWFVTSWDDGAIAVIRMVNALVISTVLGLLAILLPPRYRLVLFLVILGTFSGTGYFLFSSINPSSWVALGIGVGWLGIHAGLAVCSLSARQRIGLLLIGVVALLMAVGSRWDAPAFAAVVGTLTLGHVAWLRFPQQRTRIISAVVAVSLSAAVVLELFTPYAPSEYVRRLFIYSPGQPDNVAFFTHYAMYGISNIIRSVGSVPTHSGVLMPELVGTVGVVVIAVLLARTFNAQIKVQVVGAAFATVAASLAIMVQVELVDDRDAFGVEPRYVYPMLPFVVGWWLLLGPGNLGERLGRHLKMLTAATTAMFAVTVFTFSERFVDVQTYGLRILPEGPDQWWWSWMPVGPNVVFVVAVASVWRFFTLFRSVVNHFPDNESME